MIFNLEGVPHTSRIVVKKKKKKKKVGEKTGIQARTYRHILDKIESILKFSSRLVPFYYEYVIKF